MATVTRENIGLLNDKITVKVSQEDYLPNFEKAIKHFSKNANIPGFRKGQVPVGMIKKMSGQALFADEILKTVEKELMGYLQNEKLEIFAQPLALDTEEAKKFDYAQPAAYDFDFEVGLKPSFDVDALLSKTSITRYNVKVSDDTVEKEVERLQLKGGKMSEPETIDSENNVLTLEFLESDAKGTIVDGAGKKENTLLLKDFAPAIQEKLQGKKAGDNIVTQLSKAFDKERLEFIAKDLGLDAGDKETGKKYYQLTITKVGLIDKRELNEEFFKEVYPGQDITTPEAFREKLREEIGKYWKQEATNHLHNELFETLVHETPLELPKEFLKRWLQKGGETPKTAEEAEQEYPNFDHQLRWTLISDKLIRDNSLEVTFEELKENAKQKLTAYYGIGGDQAEWLDSYLDRLLQDEKYVDQTYREMITVKVFDWVEGKVKVKEEEITAEEFVKLPHKHHHHEH